MDDHGSVFPDGAVLVRDGLVEAVGLWSDLRPHWTGETEDLGERILLPGLVNAHCHLDYSSMRGALLQPRSFTAWIRRLNALKRELSDDEYLAAIAAGFAECAAYGTSTVLNIAALPELLPRLPPPPLRTWWFWELIDVRSPRVTDDLLAGVLAFFDGRWAQDEWHGGWGLSPHAPYTASPVLYALARETAARLAMPLTTHLAESEEEHSMFTAAEGPLYEFLSALRRPMHDCGGGATALRRLAVAGVIGSECIVAHLNELPPEDDFLLAPGGPLHGLTVVHCPRSHQFFGHRPFPLERLRALGANLCLGTDSLASNRDLSLFGEMRAAQHAFPALRAPELLAMVTRRPGAAPGLGGPRLGQIVPGAAADLLAVDAAPERHSSSRHLLEALAEALVVFGGRVDWLTVAGRRVR